MSFINIMASRHSPFYSPLLACIDGPFLRDEGLEPGYTYAVPGAGVPEGLRDGSIQLGQLAVSASWRLLDNGVEPHFRHFAQINERDGFFLAARNPVEQFDWQQLVGTEVLVDHLYQPLALFRYAAILAGLDLSEIEIIDCGEPDEIEAVFRGGVGDFVHLQGGAPQQLQKEGLATVVCALGDLSGPLAFSSLVATPEWLAGEEAAAFMRAYRAARSHVIRAPAEDTADIVRGHFPDIDTDVLAATIDRYKSLGCWTPNVDISRQSYAAALRVFRATGGIRQDYPYEEIVSAPPE